MSAPNVLVILADEHRRDALGCYGHPLVKTPNLDRLGAGGVRFTDAITPSPICVPARASLATGRHVNDNGCWSNAQPYTGAQASWGHRLREAGHRTLSFGKLHFRDTADDNGFDEEVLPMHVRGGVGWLRGLLRRSDYDFQMCHEFAETIGPGENVYTDYDRRVCDAACDWLREEGGGAPWGLFVSFVRPHYPLTCPPGFYDLYPPESMLLPRPAMPGDGADHPVNARVRRFLDYDRHFDDRTRRIAVASYYGLCSFLDDLAGRVLAALEASGAAGRTLVVYSSDHGEMLGDKGFWTKCVMYDKSVSVPMLMAGPGVPGGVLSDTPVSLVDVYPTVLAAAGVAPAATDADLPGRSLLEVVDSPDPERALLSEYHDGGAMTGMFLLRTRRWSYMHYPGHAPQLFDRRDDPDETRDLGDSAAHGPIREELSRRLREMVDPEAATDAAFASQDAVLARFGGEAGVLATPDYDFTPVPR